MAYWEEKNNPIVSKSKAFALHIIHLYKCLTSEQHEFVISKQLLRSGTSIGANIREAHRGQSDPDFYTKLNISLKEVDETAYRLELLYEGNFIEKDTFNHLYYECDELIRILVSILKNNYKK